MNMNVRNSNDGLTKMFKIPANNLLKERSMTVILENQITTIKFEDLALIRNGEDEQPFEILKKVKIIRYNL